MAPSNMTVPVRWLFVLLFAASFLMLAVMPLEAMLRDPAGLGRSPFLRLLADLPMVPQIVHLGTFAGLTFLCAWALQPLASIRASLVVAFVVAFTFGGLVELIQLFIPGRDSDLSDVVLNGIGALVGCLAAYGLTLKRSAA